MSENIKEIIISIFSTTVKVVLGIIVVMFIYKYARIAYEYGYRVFTEPPVSMGSGREISVSIGEDNSTKEIGEMLENKGLIRDGKLFILQELTSEYRGEIKPGKYSLSTSMTAYEMIEIMAQAEVAPSTEEELLYNSDEDSVNSEAESEDVIYDEDGNPIDTNAEEETQEEE